MKDVQASEVGFSAHRKTSLNTFFTEQKVRVEVNTGGTVRVQAAGRKKLTGCCSSSLRAQQHQQVLHTEVFFSHSVRRR